MCPGRSVHITNICRSVYIGIQRDDNVCHHFTTDAMKTLFCAFVLSKLDCCNSLLLGSPKHLPQNSNRSKLTLKLANASRNISNSFIRNFTGTGFIKNPVQTRFFSYSSFTEACQLVDMAQEPTPPPPSPHYFVAVPRLVSKDVVSGVFPLHCRQDLLYLRETWVLGFLKPQPLGKKMVAPACR